MTVEYLQVLNGTSLPDINRLKPYKSVVVIESPVSPEWQATASKWLVESGCLYMMAWGNECTTWDDSVDLACLEKFNFGDIADKDFVRTTWHNSEPLEEVFWFAKNSAFHSEELDNTLILHISTTGKSDEFLRMYASA
jgi:hypothetical protein